MVLKKAWIFLKDLRLTFYLLLTASGSLFIGALYTQFNYEFFQSLNETQIQDCVMQHVVSDPLRIWWLPVLFCTLSLLGINMAVCACHRLATLLSYWHKLPKLKLLIDLTPSVIHLCFLIILAGHLLTFTLGKWNRIPLFEKKPIHLIDMDSVFTVESINNEYYPEKTLLTGRISQTSVQLTNQHHQPIHLTHLEPVHFNGTYLFLVREKQKKEAFLQKNKEVVEDSSNETCNKAPVYHTKRQKDKSGLFLLQVFDPGLFPIITGLFSILVLMIFYFLRYKKAANNVITT